MECSRQNRVVPASFSVSGLAGDLAASRLPTRRDQRTARDNARTGVGHGCRGDAGGREPTPPRDSRWQLVTLGHELSPWYAAFGYAARPMGLRRGTHRLGSTMIHAV